VSNPARAYLRQRRTPGAAIADFQASPVALLPTKFRVLDLGCGSGVPVARELAKRRHAVVGIDGSARQLSLARLNVSSAHFIHAEAAGSA
jgi:SAM-dependent methyltransferase